MKFTRPRGRNKKDSVYFWSDLHLGHLNICKFREGYTSAEAHHEDIFSRLESVARFKNNTIYLLGDVAFDAKWLSRIGDLPATIHLVRGNHDAQYVKEQEAREQLLHWSYDTVEGLKKYKGFWLSHAPIHPTELRGGLNIHGHVHYATLDDPRYINVCPENCAHPVGLTELKHYKEALCMKI